MQLKHCTWVSATIPGKNMSKLMSSEIESEEITKHPSKKDKLAPRKDPKRCPVCTKKLNKTGKKTRHKHECDYCHAVLAKELTCIYCNTNRVWRGPMGSFCHGCGHRYTA